jgi:threonine/homoserine/homoserine lactone efflux protein
VNELRKVYGANLRNRWQAPDWFTMASESLAISLSAMFEFSTLVSFVAVVIALFLIPGPAVLLVFMRTAQGGRFVGIMTGLGIACGDFVHAMAAAVGLSAILMTSALAFNIVKLVGAGYLLWLGVHALLEKSSEVEASASPAAPTAVQAFFQAIPAEVLNPKTALFFLAFMPQFVHPERGSAFLQFIVLGLIFVALSAIYSGLLALSVRPLGRVLRRFAWLNRWKSKIIGTIFIGLGLKVAIQQR